MYKFLPCVCVFFLLTNKTYAQKDSIVLDGTLTVAKSATYKYKIVVAGDEGPWKGYSVLDAGGPNETKTSVSVQFSKEKASMMFAEKTVISTKAKELNFCFVGGILKMNDKKNTLKGFFLGQDNNKKMCGSGTVRFALPEAAKKLMTDDGSKDTNTAAIVTRFRSETFRVSNPQVQMELWDGGVADHDSLSVTLNGHTVLPAFEIVPDKQSVTLTLKKGENIVKIKALNEGLEAPNSARITVTDGGSRYTVVSFLKAGEEATIRIRY
jgi:hypothetical protein